MRSRVCMCVCVVCLCNQGVALTTGSLSALLKFIDVVLSPKFRALTTPQLAEQVCLCGFLLEWRYCVCVLVSVCVCV